MSHLPAALRGLRIPVIGSPMFIVSGPELVIEQCKAGIVGAMPSLNARPADLLDAWLAQIREALAAHDRRHPQRPAAPFAVNLVAHKSNDRLERDLEAVVRNKVPIVITSLGARQDVNAAIHDYGGIVLHDVTSNRFARKAIEKGADGLIAVAAGAGGHAGSRSPFAIVQEIRSWFDGPLGLGGAIANGRALLAVRALGADFAYIGSPFIATREAQAAPAYKEAVVAGSSDDIVYTDFFSGIQANYIAASIRGAGLDPANLPAAAARGMQLQDGQSKPKAWKDIWGCGQGIAAVDRIMPAAQFISRLESEYQEARRRLLQQGLQRHCIRAPSLGNSS
jgi:nitronate monooxygenase